jgi:hypothetical protein
MEGGKNLPSEKNLTEGEKTEQDIELQLEILAEILVEILIKE